MPDYWYPLVATTGADGRPLLALAELPDGAVGVTDEGVQGRLIPHEASTAIADEEVPREGVRLILEDRVVIGGSNVVVWRARAKVVGSGEGSSGLRFDVLATDS